MNLPQPGDYIDIHVHEGKPAEGTFIVESLMAHEKKVPLEIPSVAYTYGIHPWFLSEENYQNQIDLVEAFMGDPGIIAIGEAGFDKLKGPSPELQMKVFEQQVEISERIKKPLIIHCVKAWDELLSVKKNFRPEMPWMIHGFRGSIQLARQLLSKGFYLSVWFDFAIRNESTGLIKNIPADKIFLETDGADIDIKEIYKKVSVDLNIQTEELKRVIRYNFSEFFNNNQVKYVK